MFASIVSTLSILVFGLASAVATEPSVDVDVADPVDVYVLTGQSNMYGLARLGGIPPGDREPPRNCLIWNGVDFVALAPTPSPGPIGTLFGPELSFCSEMAQLEPNRLHYLIKFAVPARGLHHGWLERKWLPGPPRPDRANFYPGKSATDPNMGKHYAELRREFDAALGKLKADGIEYNIRGVLWMQGETDAVNAFSARTYAAGLARFKKRIQQDLGSGEIPFIFGQVLPQPPKSKFYAFRNEVRRNQAKAHWNSGKPAAIPGAWMVPTDDMPVGKQRLHFTAEGQILLGRAMAVASVQMRTVLADTKKAENEHQAEQNEASN